MVNYSINGAALGALVSRLAGSRVCVVGDVMIDEYLVGDAQRISPEAPVPVISVSEDRHLVGGAGNVAKNIRTLGGVPRLVSVCGNGPRSALLRRVLRDEGVDAAFVEIPGRPTTLKTRVIARQQQMLRIDREETSPIGGQHLADLLRLVDAASADCNVVIVSDYGKGVVTGAFMDGLEALWERRGTRPAVLVDPKTPNFHLYRNVFMPTPNAKETSEGAHLPTGTREEILAAGKAIFEKLHCQHLLTTLGPKGMALFEAADKVWHIPTTARSVFDVTGAGDTVIATVALALAAGVDLLESCVLANYAAGIVVGQVGAASVLPDELREAIATLPVPHVDRWA